MSQYATAAADTAVTITLAAGTLKEHRVHGIIWSYDADPTGGALTIADDVGNNMSVDITTGGPGFLPLPVLSTEGDAVTITLAAGGGTVVGKLTVIMDFDVRGA